MRGFDFIRSVNTGRELLDLPMSAKRTRHEIQEPSMDLLLDHAASMFKNKESPTVAD